MRRPVLLLVVVLGAGAFGVLVGLLAILLAVLPAPMCPPSTATLSDLLQDDDPGTLLVCLYDVHGRLMNEHHLLRQMPPVFELPVLPAPHAQEV